MRLSMRTLVTTAVPRSILLARGSRAKRRVALTFDDGPDAMTPLYLDVLERLGVRATFFVVGENLSRDPGAACAYVRRGHDVGGHGWSHDAFPPMSASRLADELANTDALLPGAARKLVRPPRGELSARTLIGLAIAGYTTVLWSVDSDDCRTRDAVLVERRVAPDRIAPGDVVLFHEMQAWTLDALPRIVAALRATGYEFVTVGDLLGAP